MAMFGVLQAVLFNPLPFREPDRIVVGGERSASIETEFVSPTTTTGRRGTTRSRIWLPFGTGRPWTWPCVAGRSDRRP